MKRTKDPVQGREDAMQILYQRPTFMIRRAHQIATAIFSECCAGIDITPSQYSMLLMLQHHGAMGQNELARRVSLDRSTTSLVVQNLIARGLVDKRDDPQDRRKSSLMIADAGRMLLIKAERLSHRAGDELLSAFDATQAQTFMKLLSLLNEWHTTRADGIDSADWPKAARRARER